jgi:hypothetical protein
VAITPSLPARKANYALSAPRITRRTLTKTAVWAVPTAALSVAAPAIAASGCTPTTLNWTDFPISSGKRNGTAPFSGGTATLSRAGRTDHSESFTTDANQNNLLRLRSDASRLGPDPATTPQTLTLRFSVEVRDLSITVYDIDRDARSGLLTTRFEDRVHITSPTPSRAEKGAEVLGTGTSADPFRMNPSAGDGNLPGAPRDPAPERDKYKVDLHWDVVPAGTSINLVYAQALWSGSPTPTIWLSNLTFCA